MPRRVVVLQGTSGSGKSTWAKGQADALIVSADKNLYDSTGRYTFTPEAQSQGHHLCLQEFVKAMVSPAAPGNLIVDNTNTQALYMAPYVAMGLAFGCMVDVLSFRAPPEVCVARNNGRAPLTIVQTMVEMIEHFTLPPLWLRDGVTYKIINTDRR